MNLFGISLLYMTYVSIIFSKKFPNEMKYTLNQNKYTLNQNKYYKSLFNEDTSLIVVTGPAGTGKTMIACKKAIDYLINTDHKVIITRPLIAVEDEKLGFLPGNINSKMQPWITPFIDYFLEDITKDKLNRYINSNKLEICPLAYMRGRTFNDAFIIADEMQNSTPIQMKMLVTRIGNNSKLVVTGDLYQSDIKNLNGLEDLVNKLSNIKNDNEIELINFDNNDISRSSLVKKIINLYEQYD